MGPAAAFVGASGAWSGFGMTCRVTSAAKAPQVRRAPEGPEGTGGLRDRPLRAKLACGDLAGGRARRRPEHQRRRNQHRTTGRDQQELLAREAVDFMHDEAAHGAHPCDGCDAEDA